MSIQIKVFCHESAPYSYVFCYVSAHHSLPRSSVSLYRFFGLPLPFHPSTLMLIQSTYVSSLFVHILSLFYLTLPGLFTFLFRVLSILITPQVHLNILICSACNRLCVFLIAQHSALRGTTGFISHIVP